MVKFYEVGGAIRDEFLGLKSKDIDYAVEAESFDAMREAIVAKGFAVKVEHPEFFTIKAYKDKGTGVVDFTLCRKEGKYRDGRHPSHVEPGTILDDLARRDFTVNAIARGDDGAIIDPYRGRDDIAVRRLACVGVAKDRFTEDGLRLLRAVRFHVTKAFWLEADIEKLLRDRAFIEARLKGVSADRVRAELLAMFTADTFFTINVMNTYPELCRHLFYKAPIWLKPTLEAR